VLTVTIRIHGGQSLAVRVAADKSREFVEDVASRGYLDPADGRYYPPNSILRIEVGPLEPDGPFPGSDLR
jgi:hypothetical protein